PHPDERKSELLPAGWEANKEVYTLRYKSTDDARELLLKAVMVEDSMILNVMDRGSQKVADVTLAVADYINAKHLDDFHKVYKNTEELRTRIASGIIAPLGAPAEKPKKEPEKEDPDLHRDYDPLRIPPCQPAGTRPPTWPSPVNPFAVGGEDLDPFGWKQICALTPASTGAGDPASQACARGARLSRGTLGSWPGGAGRSGPDPDHLPPPGYDDMFM
ncbi:PREDICTED: proteasome inhibitor PI31 subunit, partial [Pterocles gutturalis]|uniref:proteasome inhibitor PI31 subunit n=1 Tax=Pterocles gutturalis TaxID=240206 RepID=UPI000528AC4C